jgi:hypothetical protein
MERDLLDAAVNGGAHEAMMTANKAIINEAPR